MVTMTLTPYNSVLRQYRPNETTLVICDTSQAPFSVMLPDAGAVGNSQFYIQKDSANNVLLVIARYGQKICGEEYVSLTGKYQTVHIVSDGVNYRLLSGMVPEIPVTLPLGRYWRARPVGKDLLWEKEANGGIGNEDWQLRDKLGFN